MSKHTRDFKQMLADEIALRGCPTGLVLSDRIRVGILRAYRAIEPMARKAVCDCERQRD